MTVSASSPFALAAGAYPCQCSWCCGIARGQTQGSAKVGAAAAAANAARARHGTGGLLSLQSAARLGGGPGPSAPVAAPAPRWGPSPVAPQWKRRPGIDAVVERHTAPLAARGHTPAQAAAVEDAAVTARGLAEEAAGGRVDKRHGAGGGFGAAGAATTEARRIGVPLVQLGQSPRRAEWPATVVAPSLPLASARRASALSSVR